MQDTFSDIDISKHKEDIYKLGDYVKEYCGNSKILSNWISYCPEEQGLFKINNTFLDCLFCYNQTVYFCRISGTHVIASNGDGVGYDMDMVRVMSGKRKGKVTFPQFVRPGEAFRTALLFKKLDLDHTGLSLSIFRANDRALLLSLLARDWQTADKIPLALPEHYMASYSRDDVTLRPTAYAAEWARHNGGDLDTAFQNSLKLDDGRTLLPIKACSCRGIPYVDIKDTPGIMECSNHIDKRSEDGSIYVRFSTDNLESCLKAWNSVETMR